MKADASDLKGVRVFLVEDESLIMMLLEDILLDLGCEVAGSALTLKAALEGAGSADATVAICDINLGGEPSFPVAERLQTRGIPVIFASGYGAAALPPAWQGCPTLPKPFSGDQVAEVLCRALAEGAKPR